MLVADLVALKQGRPLLLVEAKGRPVEGEFWEPVQEQMRELAKLSGSDWFVLADPDTIRIYEGADLRKVAEIPTEDVLAATGISRPEFLGQRLLLVALDRWLPTISNADALGLEKFAKAIREADEFVTEYRVA